MSRADILGVSFLGLLEPIVNAAVSSGHIHWDIFADEVVPILRSKGKGPVVFDNVRSDEVPLLCGDGVKGWWGHTCLSDSPGWDLPNTDLRLAFVMYI